MYAMQLDFDGNEHWPPEDPPADPSTDDLCSCGRLVVQICAGCGKPLCGDCGEECAGCKDGFCPGCKCESCVECAVCGELMTRQYVENEGTCGGDYCELDGQPMHDYCYCESTVGATVWYSDDQDYPRPISDTFNETEGEFMLGYVHTDGWRGYYTVSSETWVRIHDDCSLAYSHDSQNLATFDELLRGMLDAHGIRWARVICTTSNVFSANYDLWIPKESQAEYDALIAQAKEAAEAQLRDPWAFAQTALTGKDPEECTETDKAFALLGSMILAADR